MLFKLAQHRHQLCQLLAAFGRGQQEQDRVKVAFLRHDAVFAQVVRQNRRRDPEIRVLAGFGIDAWRGQQELARVDKVLLACIALKAVPFGPGSKLKKRSSLAMACVG